VVGTFLAVVPRDGELLRCREVLASAQIDLDEATSTICTDWSIAVSCPRLNGSAAPITVDRSTGSWLAAVGTWFHQSGNGQIEYMLERYLAHGAEYLARELNGCFVVVVGNANTREIVVISDVIGSFHFYHRHFRAGVALSTSSLLLSRFGDTTLDPVGCQEFLAAGVVYEDRTFYNQIRKLPPASITIFRDGKQLRQQRYWCANDLLPESLSAEHASDLLWNGMVAAAASINGQYDSVACDLTGGYDSRAVAAALLGAGKKFTAVVSGPPESGDVKVSAEIAAKCGLEHIHYPLPSLPILPDEMKWVGSLTDGECDLTDYINVARIHRDLSERFAISLNGSFGEVARGYWWELLIPHTGAKLKLDSSKLARRRYAVGSHTSLLQSRYEFDLVEHFRAIVDRTVTGLESYPNTFQMDITYLRMRMQRWQGRIASSTNRIWPCVSPFMFRPVLETMLQARFAARERSFLVRLMLAKYQPELAACWLEHGYPALPATWRTVTKFWPLLPHYSAKVIRKVKSRYTRDVRDQSETTRLELWRDDKVIDLLRPESMRTMEILDKHKVTQLLEASQRPRFAEGRLWSRLLSLEYALSRASTS
jgi:hypothetical protein